MERGKVMIVTAYFEYIPYCARYIIQIAGLSVTMIETRKDPCRLEMALYSHPVKPASELLQSNPLQQPRLAGDRR